MANSLVAFLMWPKTCIAIVRKRSSRTNGKSNPHDSAAAIPFPVPRTDPCENMQIHGQSHS